MLRYSEADAKSIAEKLTAALGDGWQLTSEPLFGRCNFKNAVLARIWQGQNVFACGWSWKGLLLSYCWKSSLAYGFWQIAPRVRVSSIEELQLKLEIIA